MRFGAIVLVILCFSGFPCFSELVLTDQEAAELESILIEQVRLSEELVTLSREQRQALEKSVMASIEALKSMARSKTELGISESERSAALKSLAKLESEKIALVLLVASEAAVIVWFAGKLANWW